MATILRFKQLDCKRGIGWLKHIHPKQVEDYPNNLERFGKLLIKYNVTNKHFDRVKVILRSKRINEVLKHKKD